MATKSSYTQKRIPWRLIAASALMVVFHTACDARANVALFKSFIESPPANITNLVYKVRTTGDSASMAFAYDANRRAFEYSKELADSRGFMKTGLDGYGYRWFSAKWQQDAFLVRGIDPEQDGSTLTNNPGVFRSGGRYISNYWALFGTTLQTWTSPGPLPLDASSPHKRAKTSSAHRGALVASENLRQLLNLGIMSVNPGTIRWDGDRFVSPSIDAKGVTIKGTAIIENARVSRLELFYNEFPYLIEYGYSGELPLSYLPNRFVVSYIGNEKPEFRYEFQILAMETSPEPLGAEHFDPGFGSHTISLGEKEYFLHTTVERHWVYNKDGGPRRLGANSTLPPLTKPTSITPLNTGWRRRLVLIGLTILTLGPVSIFSAIWVRNRRISKTQPKK